MNKNTSERPNVPRLSWKELEERKKPGHELLILDLRSEKEFEKGHVTGATNLPLLNNEERKKVGTLYKEEGKNKATLQGFQYFQKKSQAFLEEIREKITKLGPEGQLLLYCARGGMRSSLTAGFLASLGYSVTLMEGGYKTYRKLVLTTLEEELNQHPFLVLHGHTGSGKTELINELAKPIYHVGTLDFEGLAHHSGSAFGDLNQKEKPATQSQFENDLYEAYKKVAHFERLVVEIESTLGQAKLSPGLRKALVSSPMVLLKRAHKSRVESLTKDYTNEWNLQKKELFTRRFELLRTKFSRESFSKLETLLEKENFPELIDILLKEHYDPQYEKSLKRYEERMIAEFSLSSQKKELLNFIKNYVSRKKSANLLRA